MKLSLNLRIYTRVESSREVRGETMAKTKTMPSSKTFVSSNWTQLLYFLIRNTFSFLCIIYIFLTLLPLLACIQLELLFLLCTIAFYSNMKFNFSSKRKKNANLKAQDKIVLCIFIFSSIFSFSFWVKLNENLLCVRFSSVLC